MTDVFIDTNFWIYLASGVDPSDPKKKNPGLYYKVIDKLTDLVENGAIMLITTEIVQNEWKKHEEKAQIAVIKAMERRDNRLKGLRAFGKGLSDDAKAKLQEVETELATKLTTEVEEAESYYKAARSLLFDRAVIIPVSKEIKAKCSDWALEKRHPFHEEKSSMADALIFFSAIDYLDRKASSILSSGKYFGQSIFISFNKRDFGDGELFPSLKEVADTVRLQYSVDLSKSVFAMEGAMLTMQEMKELEREILYEEERDFYENADFCRLCDGPETLAIINFEGHLAIENNADGASSDFSEIKTVEVGDCGFCHRDYLRCTNCGSISCTEFDGRIVCEGCGCVYTVVDVSGPGEPEEIRISIEG